jgi:hypothetical protein
MTSNSGSPSAVECLRTPCAMSTSALPSRSGSRIEKASGYSRSRKNRLEVLSAHNRPSRRFSHRWRASATRRSIRTVRLFEKRANSFRGRIDSSRPTKHQPAPSRYCASSRGYLESLSRDLLARLGLPRVTLQSVGEGQSARSARTESRHSIVGIRCGSEGRDVCLAPASEAVRSPQSRFI